MIQEEHTISSSPAEYTHEKPTPAGGLPLVLVVDDEEAVAKGLARGLARMGFETDVVFNGEEALKRLSERHFDVLLTDIHMPGMKGDALQRIARQQDPDLAVLMITAAQDIACAVQCLKEGAFDYMAKPFDLSDVAVRVNKALERRRLTILQRDHQLILEQRIEEQAEHMRLMFKHSLEALTYALEAKNEGTRNHSARVAHLCGLIAEELCPDSLCFLSRLRTAALLHDIGKIGVREAILNKVNKLDASEIAEICCHPEIGETILYPLFCDDREILDMIRHHHELWAGGGFPDGLEGDAIPLGARIIAVAGAYDALVSARPHRPKMTPQRALKTLRESAGSQWDPEVINALLALAKKGALPRTEEEETDEGQFSSKAFRAPRALQTRSGAGAAADVPVVYLIGDVNRQNVEQVWREIDGQQSSEVIIDMRRSGNPCRDGIGHLRELQRQALEAGGCITLRHVPRVIQISLATWWVNEERKPQPPAS